MWQWHLSTNIYFGENCIKQNQAVFSNLGSKALIIIGQGKSAKQNGSLDDVCEVLDNVNISWEIFSEIEPNPSIDTVRKGGNLAKKFKADFVIGIGGGSPLDAAKVIAVLAVNDLNDEDLFKADFTKALPIIVVPTTAGTGSEVTPYSVITYPAIQNKKNLASPHILPVIAFLDYKYTVTLPLDITLDTSIDAYSHALEGYLSKRANPVSDMMAERAMLILAPEIKKMLQNQMVTDESRELLLYGSLLAGMVIKATGTSIPHAMGYSFTYFKDVPHGRANAYIIPSYLDFNFRNSESNKIDKALKISGFKDIDEIKNFMRQVAGEPPFLNEEEKNTFIEICSQAKNLANNLVKPDKKDLQLILEKVFNK